MSDALKAVGACRLRQLSKRINGLAADIGRLFRITANAVTLSKLGLMISTIKFTILGRGLGELRNGLGRVRRRIGTVQSLLRVRRETGLDTTLHSLLDVDRVGGSGRHRAVLFGTGGMFKPIGLGCGRLLLDTSAVRATVTCRRCFYLASLTRTHYLTRLRVLSVTSESVLRARVF